jgi:hypothetical protein
MRVQYLYDKSGAILSAGTAAPGVRMAYAQAGTRVKPASGMVDIVDVDYAEHHTKLREMAVNFQVRVAKDGPALIRRKKAKSQPGARQRRKRG